MPILLVIQEVICWQATTKQNSEIQEAKEMKKKSAAQKPVSKEPSVLLRGDVIDAVYNEQTISIYRGNPLIEPLPPTLSEEEQGIALICLPDYDEEERNLPLHDRIHLTLSLFDVFKPWDIHTDVFSKFERLIRGGLRHRDPLSPKHFRDVNSKVEALRRGEPFKEKSRRSKVAGFTFLGTPGMGKTSTIEEILLWFPQVICHTHYKGKDFIFKQIVWLKLDCPYDGSIKGLVLSFFEAIDSLLGTDYYSRYCKDKRAARDMVPDMARIAAIHCIGVLVVDEIQFLSKLKSGGHEEMLDFFVELRNRMQIPVVLVGTPRATSILSGKLHQMRRGAGLGDVVWEPMDLLDECWDLFVESIWKYQYTTQVSPLTRKLKNALHEESFGIIDFAVKIYMLAQIRAIVSGSEKITVGIIRSVAKDDLNLPGPALKALKAKNWRAIEDYEDIFIDKAAFIKKIHGKLMDQKINAASPETQAQQEQSELEENVSQPEKDSGGETQGEGGSTSSQVAESEIQTFSVNFTGKSLLEIALFQAKDGSIPYHKSLVEAGYVRSPV
jgi:hypothetical protein